MPENIGAPFRRYRRPVLVGGTLRGAVAEMGGSRMVVQAPGTALLP